MTREDNDGALLLLRNILSRICEATRDIDEEDTDLGLCKIPNFRYDPVFEFTEDDLKIIKILQDSDDVYNFSQLLE